VSSHAELGEAQLPPSHSTLYRQFTTELAIVIVVLVGLITGSVLHLLGSNTPADFVWAGAAVVVLGPLVWSVARSLVHRDVGVDAIALLAIAAALVLGEYLTAVIVSLMLAGGNALEASANARARRELRLLVERAPRIAHRRHGTLVQEVKVGDVAPGDVVVVRAGEVVPADGVVSGEAEAVIDTSALTGEPLPVTVRPGGEVLSGTANAADAFDLVVTRRSAESAYATIVRLVEGATLQRAPFVRLADRYAAFFLPVTILVAGGAWVVSGDPTRMLAVLVVATPCPLILAAPIALVSGLSRAARVGIIVKGAGVIEQLGRARTVLFDKTGTLTLGSPEIERIVSLNGVEPTEALRLAASLDQLSAHVMAEALVHDAEGRGLRLAFPRDVREQPGSGIAGSVEGRAVVVGAAGWLEELGFPGARVAAGAANGGQESGRAKVFVGIDGQLAAMIVMADHLRHDAVALPASLREIGIRHVALVTGDSASVGEEIGRLVGVDRVYSEQLPEDKLEVVKALRARKELCPVVMVGDGINDAPALALADVGIALGAQGATVSSETADVVITVDRVDRVADALRIGRRSLGIARQSVLVGMGLSLAAMAVAAAGYLPPVYGALLQEGIDVAVIINALRALKG
jgi:heavy metal translocating P-type ATPase